jgi:Tol biopolymer transport system component
VKPLDELHRYANADDERLRLAGFDQIERRRLSSHTPGLVAASVVVLVVALIGAGIGLGFRRGPTPEAAATAPVASATPIAFATPVLAVAAPLFHGLGRLAFAASTIGLEVLDGASGRVQPIDDSAVSQWSHDGSWLAYVRSSGGPASELWLSRADGSGRQRVGGLPASTTVLFVWSPTQDVLAVVPAGGAARGLWLVRPDQAASLLVAGDAAVWSAAWSPDGQSLAYSVTLPFTNPIGRSDALFTISASGGSPTQRLVADNAGVLGINWWPNGRGLLYYRDGQHSASLLVDGVPLESLALDGSRPSGAFPDLKLIISGQWIDDQRFVAVTGGGRWPTSNKNLAICDIQALICTVVAQAAGSVALEPALSRDRDRIAFVRAPDRGQVVGFATDAEAQQWIASRALWILDLGSGQAREVQAAGRGVLEPAWSGDGNTLLFTRDRAGWLYDLKAGTAAQLIAPLDPATPFGGPGWNFAWQR